MNKTSHKKNRPFDFKLIDLVEPHPIIYMRHIPGMSAFEMLKTKSNMWQQIANQMGHTVRFCLSRWNNLRGQFQKELLRSSKLCHKSGVLRHSTWPYLKRLRFLETTFQFNEPKKMSDSKRSKHHKFLIIDDYESHNCDDENAIDANILNPKAGCDDDGYRDGNNFAVVNHAAAANCIAMDVEDRNAHDQALQLQPAAGEQNVWADEEDDYHLVEYLEDDAGCNLTEEEMLGIYHSLQPHNRNNNSTNCSTALQTIQTLLMEFDDVNRRRIERRILAYLCKCQLRLLSNCDINHLGV